MHLQAALIARPQVLDDIGRQFVVGDGLVQPFGHFLQRRMPRMQFALDLLDMLFLAERRKAQPAAPPTAASQSLTDQREDDDAEHDEQDHVAVRKRQAVCALT